MTDLKNTRTVVRPLLPWSDAKHEGWLTEQARSGWHVKRVHGWGYSLERGEPADVAYRLDVRPWDRAERDEYLALFRDAGWEHVGSRGVWEFFRKPVVGGEAPEIHTDPVSRIAIYRRAMVFLAGMTIIPLTVLVPALTRSASTPLSGSQLLALASVIALAAFFLYGTVRLVLVINRLKKQRRTAG